MYQAKFFAKILFLCAVLTVLSGCSSQSANSQDITLLKTQVAGLQAENQKLKQNALQQENTGAPANPPVSTSTPVEPTKTSIPTPALPTPTSELDSVPIGKTITIANYIEFTIEKIYFSNKILPPNPSEFYTYYEAKDPGTTYLDTVISVKNLQTSGLVADKVGTVTVVYDNKYQYSSFSTIEQDAGGNFTYTNITNISPLTVGVIHYLATVPIEVESSKSPIRVIFNDNGTEYKVNFR